MTLDEARAAVGRKVTYTPTSGPPEDGTIMSVNSVYVFVQYDRVGWAKATRAQDLTLRP